MLSIIIVNFNTFEHLSGCLESLSTHTNRDGYEILIINNGDPAPSSFGSEFPLSIQTVNNPCNRGYAAALNQGARLTSADTLLLLNADTRLREGAIEPLTTQLLRSPNTGVIAPRLEYPDGSLQFSCRRNYTPFAIAARRSPLGMLPIGEPALRRHLMLDEDHSKLISPDWVQGSCLMLPRHVFEEAGGFDERFFLYFEDYDFCRRIRGLGYEVTYEPASRVVHYYSRSSRNENLLQREFWSHFRSALRYFVKNKYRISLRKRDSRPHKDMA